MRPKVRIMCLFRTWSRIQFPLHRSVKVHNTHTWLEAELKSWEEGKWEALELSRSLSSKFCGERDHNQGTIRKRRSMLDLLDGAMHGGATIIFCRKSPKFCLNAYFVRKILNYSLWWFRSIDSTKDKWSTDSNTVARKFPPLWEKLF